MKKKNIKLFLRIYIQLNNADFVIESNHSIIRTNYRTNLKFDLIRLIFFIH